jgi:hypothetical protein
MRDDIWMMTRAEYHVSCYQNILETARMSQGGGCRCIRTGDAAKLRWYSEAETMDEEELSRRKDI